MNWALASDQLSQLHLAPSSFVGSTNTFEQVLCAQHQTRQHVLDKITVAFPFPDLVLVRVKHESNTLPQNKVSDQKAWSSLITVFLSGFIYFMWLVERSSWLNLWNRLRIWALLTTSTVTTMVASSLIGITATSHDFSCCHSFILSLYSQHCSWSYPFKTSQIMSSLCPEVLNASLIHSK